MATTVTLAGGETDALDDMPREAMPANPVGTTLDVVWPFRSTTFLLNAPGNINADKIQRFIDYMAAYKAQGVNTVSLYASVPVDPNTGHIEQNFQVTNLYSKAAVSVDYVAAFTDIARGLGLNVIWKPQFTVDDGADNNVNDYFLGNHYGPRGGTFSTATFLSDVKDFWAQWASVAQQHGVSMLVLGTEQGQLAGPQFEAEWVQIIQAARSKFSGLLTYAENAFTPLYSPSALWSHLDLIGIDNYSTIGNGTDNTPYAVAYSNIFSSQIGVWNTNGPRIDIPGLLYDLHLKYGKPVFFTEFGTSSINGAMNDPAVGGNGPANLAEQANYYQANFDVFQNYDWMAGINVWNSENEISISPANSGWLQYLQQWQLNGYEFLGKPAAEAIAGYWRDGAAPPPIHASSARNADGSYYGTANTPDTLVGGYQGDLFDHLGGVYRIFAAGGVDKAVFDGKASDYAIWHAGQTTTIAGSNGTGELHDVEILQFADTVVDFRAIAGISGEGPIVVEGNEGATRIVFHVRLDRPVEAEQSLAYLVSGSGLSPVDNVDFVGNVWPSGRLTFAIGDVEKDIAIEIRGDTTVEQDEDFIVTLSTPTSGLIIGVATIVGKIINDDAAASIVATNARAAEGNSGNTVFTFTLTLTGDTSLMHSVAYAVTGTGANPANADDFTGSVLPSGVVTFAIGETSKTVTINVAGDTVVEPDEGFLVTLSNPSAGLVVGTASATGTIQNDDPVVSIAAAAAVKAEGNSGTTPFTFTLTQTGDTSVAHSVAYAVTGSSANPANAADFAGGVLPSGVVSFAIGETTKTVTINIAGDATVEQDNGFTVTLSNPSTGLAVGTASAGGTILNDDLKLHDDAYVILPGYGLAATATAGVLANDETTPPVTATLQGGVSHGQLQLAADGGLNYTPTGDFAGIDSFTYHVTGANGAAGDAQALIYVVPVNVGGSSTTLNLLALTAEQQIASTYVAFFGRAADAGGFEFWVGEFNRGLPVQGPAALFANIASSFGVSNEAKALYPFLVTPFGASDAQISSFLETVYHNMFNRGSDVGGLAYWTSQIKATLAAGQFVGSVLVNIMNGAQDTADGRDITTLMGKVAVSLAYVHEQQDHHTVWAGASDTAAATSLLHTVTADAQTVLTGIKNAEALITG
jgi:hypothetical protein